MSDAAFIFLACFGASLATSVFWRLKTQRNHHLDQQADDGVAQGDCFPIYRYPFHDGGF